ncbi:MAG: single-stranded DNA-binding protein [Candidatus Ancillula sp.]|jgi:single-stranded DNA-binding protein|nr:single-stranded DNA-binding protein [Candidatus Ancillula sp.]
MTYKVKFEGNIGNDIYYQAPTDDKKAFASFNIAETHTLFKDGKPQLDENGKRIYSDADWAKVKAFGDLATQIFETASKGKRVSIAGKIDVEARIDTAGVPVAEKVIIATKFDVVSFEKSSKAIEEELLEIKEHGFDPDAENVAFDEQFDEIVDETVTVTAHKAQDSSLDNMPGYTPQGPTIKGTFR